MGVGQLACGPAGGGMDGAGCALPTASADRRLGLCRPAVVVGASGLGVLDGTRTGMGGSGHHGRYRCSRLGAGSPATVARLGSRTVARCRGRYPGLQCAFVQCARLPLAHPR